MVPSLLATLLFALSVMAASRSIGHLGSNLANFWRVFLAAVLLGLWGHTVGQGLAGPGLAFFFLSGCVGFGLGDVALFQAIPRLGPHLSSLLINCFAAPMGALIEWLWLGQRLTSHQLAAGGVILAGVALALAPKRGEGFPSSHRWLGIFYGLMAALGQAGGAVLSRKAFAMAASVGQPMDGGTAAYQRILGGLLVAVAVLAWQTRVEPGLTRRGPGWRWLDPGKAWKWVILNALSGPAIGVGLYQWGLAVAPSGVVLSIVATTPLAVMPLAWALDGKRPGKRAMGGSLLAVAGVIGLIQTR